MRSFAFLFDRLKSKIGTTPPCALCRSENQIVVPYFAWSPG